MVATQAQVSVKEFSAERQIKLRRLGGEDGVTNGDLLLAVEALRAEVAELRNAPSQQIAPLAEDHPALQESLDARVEIAQMVRMIGKAKLEIASIKNPMAEDDDRMEAAASELDAIVQATETSTHKILAASEEIEQIVRKITGLHADDEDVNTLGDQIATEIIKIFEACNFQDITGQRVTKVVKTLRFIEEKIIALIHVWGIEAFADLPMPEGTATEGDDGLMSGPQLENQGITQDDIDALFD